jgi:hypothetical protein
MSGSQPVRRPTTQCDGVTDRQRISEPSAEESAALL